MLNRYYDFSFVFVALIFCNISLLVRSPICRANTEVKYEDPLENIFGKIQYAALLIRHGDRYPLETYPNDPYKNYAWPGGGANLNERGKSKQYRLGRWFRNRYNHLVTGKWEEDKKNFKMHSSNVNRTHLSGMYLQYGFYRLNETNLTTFEVDKWEPIEIQVIPKEEDNVLGLWRQKQCKYFIKRKKHLYRIPTIREKLEGQDGIVAYIAKNAGYDFSNVSLDEQYDILANVHDIITSQIENGVKLPDWVTKIFPQPFDQVVRSRIRIKNRDPVCLRFTAGPFLNLLITEMKEHIERYGLRQPILHFFMAHDYVSMVVMSALGTAYDLIPPYASAIIFELRKKGDFDFVTMSFKNTTSGPPFLLEIPACGPLCAFDTFFKVTENCHIFPDWNSACNEPYRVYR